MVAHTVVLCPTDFIVGQLRARKSTERERKDNQNRGAEMAYVSDATGHKGVPFIDSDPPYRDHLWCSMMGPRNGMWPTRSQRMVEFPVRPEIDVTEKHEKRWSEISRRKCLSRRCHRF